MNQNIMMIMLLVWRIIEMKKGRKYIKPTTGRGDEIKNMKKATPKVDASGKTWDGVSRPSNDAYREEFNRIFNNEKEE